MKRNPFRYWRHKRTRGGQTWFEWWRCTSEVNYLDGQGISDPEELRTLDRVPAMLTARPVQPSVRADEWHIRPLHPAGTFRRLMSKPTDGLDPSQFALGAKGPMKCANNRYGGAASLGLARDAKERVE